MELSRWKTFEKRQQLLMIGSELMRAMTWQYRDNSKFVSAIERGLSLVDLALSDEQWKNNFAMLLFLRQEMAAFYISKHTRDISYLYRAL